MYEAIGRNRKVGLVARRLTLKMDASPFSDAEQGTQMIALLVLASFVAMTCGLRVRWLAKRLALAR
jgi:hypothetical protein